MPIPYNVVGVLSMPLTRPGLKSGCAGNIPQAQPKTEVKTKTQPRNQ